MQPELKTKLEAAAVSSGRSLNAEIVDRLERSFYEAPLAGLSAEDVMKVTDHVIKSLYTDYVRKDQRSDDDKNLAAEVVQQPVSGGRRSPKPKA